MFVRDHPPPIYFPQAQCQKKIDRRRLAVGSWSLAAHARESEGDIGAGSHVHLLNLKANRAARPGKEKVPALPVSVEPNAFERRRNIEHHEIGGMTSEDTVVILPPHRIRPRFNQIPHLNFIIRDVLLVRHCRSPLSSIVGVWREEGAMKTWLAARTSAVF